MRITTKGRYALRAILFLVHCSDDKPVSIKTLSEKTHLSPEFLEQIFFRLRKADVIISTRGPGGGFTFLKDPASVSIHDIFLAVEEGYHVAPCTELDHDKASCEFSSDCVACDFWNHTNDAFVKYFSQVSIQDVVDRKFPELL
jgi:Rrf2 family transcriptional regulator, iron-sulfur cluster assembly transcription factor